MVASKRQKKKKGKEKTDRAIGRHCASPPSHFSDEAIEVDEKGLTIEPANETGLTRHTEDIVTVVERWRARLGIGSAGHSWDLAGAGLTRCGQAPAQLVVTGGERTTAAGCGWAPARLVAARVGSLVEAAHPLHGHTASSVRHVNGYEAWPVRVGMGTVERDRESTGTRGDDCSLARVRRGARVEASGVWAGEGGGPREGQNWYLGIILSAL